MRKMKMKNVISEAGRFLLPALLLLMLTSTAYPAVPGIIGPSFSLVAKPAYLTEPDGAAVYSWGYGCSSGGTQAPTLGGATYPNFNCPTMQVPGPTLVVTEGQTVTVMLTNNLPTAAGNTSILFPGFNVCAATLDTTTGACTGTATGVAGLLTQEAAPGGTVTYTFVASTPGTRAYYSGTQGDLQVEMGLYGAIVVLPASVSAACTGGVHATNLSAKAQWGESDFRLAAAAYNHPGACYDREYLFQFSEMDQRIHREAEAQSTLTCTACMTVASEPYLPSYYMVNGRSMPDLMDPNYASEYPHQPYNGNPHMHPGELTLLRVIGTGRWQHPFHEHGNHVRILARDGNLILSQSDANSLAGPLLFTTTTTPGLAFDGIFYWTGKGLNWDAYGHNPGSTDSAAKLACTPDANGYNTGFAPSDTNYTGIPVASVSQAINYFEWCQDHNKPLQTHPFGDVAAGGPATLPDPNLFTNGAWFSGSPYLGPDATTRATFGTPCASVAAGTPCGTTGTTPPSGTIANDPSTEAGFAFMWHSHNEREITTNNIFPGGMLMMMLVDSREFVIDESK